MGLTARQEANKDAMFEAADEYVAELREAATN